MTGAYAMAIRSWYWRRTHRPESVGFERPQVETRGSVFARVLSANHMIPLAEKVQRAFPPRKAA